MMTATIRIETDSDEKALYSYLDGLLYELQDDAKHILGKIKGLEVSGPNELISSHNRGETMDGSDSKESSSPGALSKQNSGKKTETLSQGA